MMGPLDITFETSGGARARRPRRSRRPPVTDTVGQAYDLLLVGDLDVARIAVALAAVASVPVEAVSVAARDEERDWGAPVLCTYEARRGDVSWYLDLYLTGTAPAEAEVAARLAVALDRIVLYSGPSVRPSAWWSAAPDGPPTRARVYEPEREDGEDGFVIDAIERPVALLPGVRVEPLPED
jgi:hypothetical protein